MYSEDDVVQDVANTLICHVTGFFPPPVNVSWTKNNQIVSEGMSLSQYRLNSDGTFNIFSTLKFTPKEGDIYSCTVNHRSIPGQPQTKTWGETLLHRFRGCVILIVPKFFALDQLIYYNRHRLKPFRANMTYPKN